jgi:hypothetical protein
LGGVVGLGRRLARLMAVVAGVVVLIGAVGLRSGAVSHPASRIGHLTDRQAAVLPLGAQSAVSAALGRDEPGYRVLGLRARNPAQRLDMTFSVAGVSVASGAGRIGLSLAGFGYATALAPVAPAVPHARANRVGYAHSDGVTEWYANGPLGLEQGFDVAKRPRTGSGALTLSLALSGDLHAHLGAGGVILSGHGVALRYDGLIVRDASGRTLRSWLRLQRGRLFIKIADDGASYPLRVDPFIQQGNELTGSGETGDAQFGKSVALSSDGSTALIGGPYDNSSTGGAWVFTRSGSTWTEQGGELTADDESGAGEFGWSVALSADGDTALIGGPGDNGYNGAGWVFTRSGSTWTQQGGKLTADDETGGGGSGLGTSAALSADGNTALIGGDLDNTGGGGSVGAAWVFTRSGSAWAQQGSKLTADDESGYGSFGKSAALSGDGDTALIGGPDDNSGVGAAWVFTRSDTTWSQEDKLTADDESGHAEFGSSVAMSGDGGTALVGGPDDSTFVGAAWVFTGSDSDWTQQGSKLTGTFESGAQPFFGASVALDGDGDTALVGAPQDGNGSAWLFTRSGSTWTEPGTGLTGTDEGAGAYFGQSAALSTDGGTALIGSPADNSGVGGAWAFGGSASAAPSPPTVEITSPVNGASYSYGQLVIASYACVDGAGGTGIVACAGPVASGRPLSTTPAGEHSFTVTATSADGQTAASSSTYTVNGVALSGHPTSHGATVTDEMTCYGSAGQSCMTTEQLTTNEKPSKGQRVAVTARKHKRRTAIVATKRIAIKAGDTASVTITLNGTGKRLLKHFGKLPVTLAISLAQNGQHQTVAKLGLTLKPAKPKHK